MNPDRGLSVKLFLMITTEMRADLQREAQERIIPIAQVVRDRCFPPKSRGSQAK